VKKSHSKLLVPVENFILFIKKKVKKHKVFALSLNKEIKLEGRRERCGKKEFVKFIT